MNMTYRSDWAGKAVVAVVIVTALIVVAAFALGGAVSEQLQWLNPQIAQAIANFKAEQTRNLRLTNDKLQEEIHQQQIEDTKLQKLADIEVAERQAWSTEWPQLLQTLIAAVADVVRMVGLGFTLLVAYLIYRQYANRMPQPLPARDATLRLKRADARTRTFAFQVNSLDASEFSPEPDTLVAHLETPREKERYRFLRELGRHREALRRSVNSGAALRR